MIKHNLGGAGLLFLAKGRFSFNSHLRRIVFPLSEKVLDQMEESVGGEEGFDVVEADSSVLQGDAHLLGF